MKLRFFITLSIVSLLAGCNTVYKSTVILTEVEDTLMKEWARAHNDGKTTPELDRKVVAVHTKFSQACLVAAVYLKASGKKDVSYWKAFLEAKEALAPLLELLRPILSESQIKAFEKGVAAANKL